MSFIQTYECEEKNLHIKWTERGRIIFYHLDTMKPTGHIEQHTKTAINKIIKFIERDESIVTPVTANFNAPARKLIEDNIFGMDILFDEDIFYAKVNNTETAGNKLYSHGTKNPLKMAVHKEDKFERGTRYLVDFQNNGSIEFYEFEKVAPENLNMEYSETLFCVY